MKAVNLIPSEQRRVQPTGKRAGSSYVVVGVLATLLALAVAYVVTSNRVTERESDAAAAKAEADRLEAQAAQRSSFTSFADIKATRLMSVSTVANGRFDWERLMEELARVMPSGSWLQSADASVSPDAAAPLDGASTSTTAPSGPSATLVGCTPKQTDVAGMMVRMRQMHRVADVQLNESSTDVGDTGEISAESCGRYYQFDLTLTFSQALSGPEAPRGASRVPASLGGGS